MPSSAYVHVPFCRHRCGYCDFTLVAGRDDLTAAYLRGLKQELRYHPHDQREIRDPLSTLFFGGGTPTHPGPQELSQLLALLNDRFQLAGNAEVTAEANPLDLTDEKLSILRDHGVNRLSLGVQSFNNRELQVLERDHTREDLQRLLPQVRSNVSNLSLDLIFGVPGQTLAEWEETLRQALSYEPDHLSTYGLTFEAGTAFETRRRRGELAAVPEELDRDLYSLTMDILETAGYQQYEISSFARPGKACRHNQVYWSGDEYFAYGPGAARYLNGRRETNIRSVIGWLARLERGLTPVADVDELDPATKARELIFLGLRRNCGISRQEFRRRTHRELAEVAGPALLTHLELGSLEWAGDFLRLTRTGRFIADRIMSDFL